MSRTRPTFGPEQRTLTIIEWYRRRLLDEGRVELVKLAEELEG